MNEDSVNYSLNVVREATLNTRRRSGDWRDTAPRFSLAGDEVIIVRAPLPAAAALDAAAVAALLPDELARAEDAGQHPDRQAELRLGRGVLRLALETLGLSRLARTAIVTNQHGAPRFAPTGTGESDLRFGITHARGCLAVAIARGQTPGIDIELTERRLSVDALARRVMDDHEQAWFARQCEDVRRRALLEAWVGKEAVLKAMGTGVHGVTRSVRVLDAADVSRASATGEREVWFTTSLLLEDPWIGCLALRDRPARVRQWWV